MCTLLKASVYSIVLQQQIWNGDEAGEGEGDERVIAGRGFKLEDYEGEVWGKRGEGLGMRG